MWIPHLFYVFGSKSSKDWDILFIVDKLESTIDLNHKKIEYLTNTVKYLVPINCTEVNGNLAVISNGVISKVFKGTHDEVNNSLYNTYSLHKQYFDLKIDRLLDRDILLKSSRFCRFLLSFYSRTEYRKDIKLALRGNLGERLKYLKQLDLATPIVDKKETLTDIYKVIAFQIGQTLLLINNIEVYSKEEVLEHYPSLSNFILRNEIKSDDMNELNRMKNILVDKIELFFKDEFEYKELKSEFL